MKTCAVIPAAGRGERLGLDRPKILAPIDHSHTVWDVLAAKLAPLVDHTQLVLSTVGSQWFPSGTLPHRVSVAIQDEPRGMGDAVFTGQLVWSRFERILVIWGDQVNLSRGTLGATLDLHATLRRPGCVLPLVRLDNPYVQLDFDDRGGLHGIRQTREGDQTDAAGWSDAGLFVLSTRGLARAWGRYLRYAEPGYRTAEINFLPFLVYLARVARWPVRTLVIGDAAEARGVNTPADLEFARQRAQAGN
jgi:bifunctional N-acetylglucosamine-1-phosphate-uridyltransferase/glucosamine-1-phosphate-acetyltransferase GlmU-like protein